MQRTVRRRPCTRSTRHARARRRSVASRRCPGHPRSCLRCSDQKRGWPGHARTRLAMTEVGAGGGAPRDDGADSVVATRSRILMVRCAPLSRMMRERTHCRPFNFKQQSVHMVRDGAMRLLTMRVRVHLSSHETSSCEEAAGGRVSKDGTPGDSRHTPSFSRRTVRRPCSRAQLRTRQGRRT